MNTLVIMLGTSVGATATGQTFLTLDTLKIVVLGVIAFGFGTAGGVLSAKLMNLVCKEKTNPGI
jgi:oxaloacetate decarboxylase beta subunit